MASTRERNGRFTGLYRDAQGKQWSAGTFGTEKEALKAARHAEALANPPEPELIYPTERRGKITVSAYGKRWLTEHRLEPTSRENYASLFKHIEHGLGTLAVSDLDAGKIRRFLRRLEGTKLSTCSVGHVRTVLRSLCRSAVSDGVLAAFPPDDAWETSPVRNREMTIATAAQVDQIEAAVPAWFRLWVRTAYVTGMRYGEVAGLGPEHVILKDDHAVILAGRRVITEVSGKPVVKSYGKTKNAVRKIIISRELGEKLIANARDGWIFRAPRGGYFSRSNARRIFKPAVASVGLPEMRLHDIRHSAISAWVHAGKPLDAIMARAGHGDLKTLSRYTHDLSDPETWLGETA